MKEKSFVGSWIRQTTRGKKRYYSVIDGIAGVTASKNPRDYWYHVKNRPMGAARLKLSTLCRQLRLKSPDGKYYLTDCADKNGMRLILRSLPSKAAGPILRRKRYNIENLQKYLAEGTEHKCKNLIGSYRHAAAENQQSLRRESPAAARARKRAQDAKSASLHSADLWGRFRLALYRFLKNLYRSSA